MATMRELIDLTTLVADGEVMNIDAPIGEQEPNRLMAYAKRLDVLRAQVRAAIEAILSTAASITEEVTVNGVNAETVRKRNERDAKRRDQLSTLTKKQSAIRASMGT